MPRVLTSKIDQIDGNSRLPKYRQVINNILWEIDKEILKPGERIPSINETSEEYYLSRDTVEKAYRELSRRGIITSVPGKGYYVNVSPDLAKLKVIVIFNKLSPYKQAVYNSFVHTLGKNAATNLYIHGYDPKFFESIVLDNLGSYDYYVIMPHFYEHAEQVQRVLKKIPRNKLLFLDRKPDDIGGHVGAVYQDFRGDLQHALRTGIRLLEKYHTFYLVYPEDTRYPHEIKEGFREFCATIGIRHELISSCQGHQPQKGEAFLTIRESDMLQLIKQTQAAKLTLGQDVGLVSYNDTPVKEILAGGITVITTDHARMGQTAADMILNKRREVIRNPFFLIPRKSL
ncbi:MAG: GntR family transcriptional regulator [Bacteroidetes bacterium]|nr:MAG: GntR family transcriptional regulator [Bacteroidota bacterium]